MGWAGWLVDGLGWVEGRVGSGGVGWLIGP